MGESFLVTGANARVCAMLLQAVRATGDRKKFPEDECLAAFKAVGILATSLDQALQTIEPPSNQAFWAKKMKPFDDQVRAFAEK